MNTQSPRVTVVMPVYNGARYLREAIDSILLQSFRDFELLIIDDGSTDASAEIVRSYGDSRIRLLTSQRNMRIAATLNRGLDEARGEYIARMDADDICHLRRLEKQVSFLDANPAFGVCGTRARAFGTARYLIRHPAKPEQIRCRLLFNTAFVHPSVIMRRSLLQEHGLRYGELRHFEDLELWQRAADHFPCANLDISLLMYRVAQRSAFHGADSAEQRETYRRIDREALGRLGIDATEEDLEIHHGLRNRSAGADLDCVEKWLLRLRDANRHAGRYCADVFEPMLADYWFVACSRARTLPAGGWERFAGSSLANTAARKWHKRLYCLASSARLAISRGEFDAPLEQRRAA